MNLNNELQQQLKINYEMVTNEQCVQADICNSAYQGDSYSAVLRTPFNNVNMYLSSVPTEPNMNVTMSYFNKIQMEILFRNRIENLFDNINRNLEVIRSKFEYEQKFDEVYAIKPLYIDEILERPEFKIISKPKFYREVTDNFEIMANIIASLYYNNIIRSYHINRNVVTKYAYEVAKYVHDMTLLIFHQLHLEYHNVYIPNIDNCMKSHNKTYNPELSE